MKKRILSIVLSIVMLVSLLPTTAFAAIRYDYTPVTDLLADGYGYFINDTLQNLTDETSVGGSNKTVTVKEIPIPHAHDMSVDCGGSGVTFEPWDGTGTFPGGNVYLTKDITLTEALTISGTVNLCLNGHSITHSGNRTITVSEDATLNICDCGSGGSVTNSSGSTYSSTYGIYNSGTVNVYGGTVECSYYGIHNEGTLTVYGGSVASTGGRGIFNMEGTVYVYGGTVSGYFSGIVNMGGTVNVTDGTVTATGSGSRGIINDDWDGTKGVVNIYGGTVSGYSFGIYNAGGVNVTDGTVTATGSSGFGIYNYSNGTVTVSGGTVTATGSSGFGIYNYSNGTVTVSGGTVTATGDNSYGIYNYGTLELSGAPTITGATAGVYLEDGSITLGGAPTITGATAGVYLEDGSITLGGALTYVEERAISVGMDTPGTFTSGWTTKMGGNAANYGSYFTSANDGYTVQPDGNELKLALETPAHAHDMSVDCGGSGVTFEPWDGTGTFPGGNVYLTKNITLTEALTISGTVNLCLNGHSITHSGNRTITVSKDATLNICDCGSGGSVTNSGSTDSITYGIYNSGTVNVYGGTVECSYYGIHNEGTLTVYGGSVAGTGDRGISNIGGTVYVYGGTVSGYIYGILNEGGTVNVTDGTVTATGSSGCGIRNFSNGTVTVSGGSVAGTGNIGISNTEGTVYVYGGTVSGYRLGISNDGGTVNVTDGTVTATGDNSYGIHNARWNGTKGVVNIYGGNIGVVTSNIHFGIRNEGGTVYVYGGSVAGTGDRGISNMEGTVYVYGGTVSGYKYGIVNLGGTVNVTGGTVSGYKHGIVNHGGTVNVTGGIVSGYEDGILNEGGTVNVTDGTVTATGSSGCGISNFSNGTVTVSGGTVTATGDNSYCIINYSNSTVTVSGGTVECSHYGIINQGTLTVSSGSVAGTGDRGISNQEGTVYVYGGTVSGYWLGISNVGGTVNVTDGTVTATGDNSYGISSTTGYTGTKGVVNIYGGNIGVVTSNIHYGISNEGGTVNVYGGTVSGYRYGIHNLDGTVNVTDGTVSGYYYGISNYSTGTGTVTVSGGTVTANSHGIINGAGSLGLSGGTVTATGDNSYGIYNYSNGTVTVSGAPTITGATAGVYLKDGSITLGGALTYVEERAIRVGMKTPGTFTSGWTTKMGGNAANYGSYFTSANDGYTVQPDGNELKLAPALTGVSAEGYSGSYDGNAHGITVTVPDGATVEYGTTEGVYTAARPTYTDAGSYTVYYKVTKDGFAPVIGSAVVSISKINPSYELPMGVTATYGDTLEDIKISDWGSGWSWKEPTTSVGDVGAKTFVAVFTPTDTNNYKSIEVDITVTVNHAEPGYNPPTAKQDLVYSGIEKELVNKGTATGGSMQYALGADGTTAPASGWSTYVPVGRDAGTYYVWYKVVGDETHNDVAPACVAVTIAKKEIGISWSNTALTYNGAAQQPTATATGVVTGEQIALLLSAPETNAGSYTATVHSIDGATAQNYKLPTNKSTSFTIEQQALTILWGNGTFTYDSTEKFPAFNVEGIWNADDVQVTKAGAQTNAGEYTAQITGLTGSDAGNYKLTGTLTKDFVINKADQAAPAVNKADETISGKNDGKITDVTANMEYRAEGEDRYTAITGESVENLADGKYYVRVKGDSNHNPSADTAVVIGAGRMLTVTVPQNQVGYTMTVDKSTAAYGEAVKVTFALNDGYSAADGFAVKLNGSAITLSNGEYTVANTTEDLAFTVEGVADITAPLAQIDIKNNKWTSFWNGVTFGLFFNETQDVTVTATDTGSGVNAIQYYLASGELELEEVKQIPVWQDYNGTFQIDPDNAYVVYVKVTDNAGNVSYLNSDGVILDQTVPVLVGIENGEDYYGDKIFKALDDYLDTLKVDGVDVTDEMNGDNEYTIVADNAEHIVTVTDKAGNVTEYRITVYKNYTVTYKVDGNTVSTQTVGHGKDATAPSIPTKDGYTQTTPAWDKDGTNITADTEINAVYTINEYTITFMDENGVYKTLTVKHGEAVTMPEVPAKDGYTVTWDTTNEKATDNATVNAVYTKNAVSDNPPQTGDNSNLWLWWILLIVSAFGITVICIEQKKCKTMR